MILDFTESPLRRWFKSFTAQPHQPFFVLGFFVFVYSMVMLSLFLLGVISIDITLFHSYNLAQMATTAFFLGFLLTVLYRFLLVVPFLYDQYMIIFWFLLSGFIFSQLAFVFAPTLLWIGQCIVLVSQIYACILFVRAYLASNADSKTDPFLLIFFFSFGALSNIIFILANFFPQLQNAAIQLSFYVFSVGVVFAVAQKMVTNFFGFYLNRTPVVADKKILLAVVCAILGIAFSKIFAIGIVGFFANLVGAVSVLHLLKRQDLIFHKLPPVLWILQIGLFWLVTSFLTGALSYLLDFSPLLQLHAFALGFIGSMIIGFGSRVTLGHSNAKIEADRLTTFIFVSFQAVVLLRLVAVFVPVLLLPSAILLCIVLSLWLYRYAPVLLKA